MSSSQGVDQHPSIRFWQELDVDVLVPVDEIKDMAVFLGSCVEDHRVFEQIQARQSLLLDETVSALVVLRGSFQDEKLLKSRLNAFEIILETFAASAPSSASGDTNESQEMSVDLVDSITSERTDRPHLAISNIDSIRILGGSERRFYAAWTTEIHLDHSRISMKNPVFSFRVMIKHSASGNLAELDKIYLLSAIPGSMNVFEPLKSSPTFEKNPPYLPASMLQQYSEHAPYRRAELTIPLQHDVARKYPSVSALTAELNVLYLSHLGSQHKVIAAVVVQVARSLQGSVRIERLDLALPLGRVERVEFPGESKLPVTCGAGDCLSFVYCLSANLPEAFMVARLPDQKLSMRLRASVSLENVQESHYRLISITASHLVKLTYLITDSIPLSLKSAESHLSLNTSGSSQESDIAAKSLVSITISAPPGPVHVGSTITWSLLVVNRSKTRSLNLAIIPLSSTTSRITPVLVQDRVRSDASAARLHSPVRNRQLPLSYFTLAGPGAELNSPFPILSDEKPSSGRALITPSSPEVRLGPILPGAGATTKLQFSVLGLGVGGMHAVRIVDLESAFSFTSKVESANRGDTQHWIDVKGSMLPTVIAVNKHARLESPHVPQWQQQPWSQPWLSSHTHMRSKTVEQSGVTEDTPPAEVLRPDDSNRSRRATVAADAGMAEVTKMPDTMDGNFSGGVIGGDATIVEPGDETTALSDLASVDEESVQ